MKTKILILITLIIIGCFFISCSKNTITKKSDTKNTNKKATIEAYNPSENEYALMKIASFPGNHTVAVKFNNNGKFKKITYGVDYYIDGKKQKYNSAESDVGDLGTYSESSGISDKFLGFTYNGELFSNNIVTMETEEAFPEFYKTLNKDDWGEFSETVVNSFYFSTSKKEVIKEGEKYTIGFINRSGDDYSLNEGSSFDGVPENSKGQTWVVYVIFSTEDTE